MANGYIKVHRKMMEWGWYKDANTMRVFFHLLLNANYTEGEFMGYRVKPGQVVCGRKQLAEDLGLSERAVRTAINHLKSTNEVTTKTTNKFTIITIENWGKYQLDDDINDQQNDQQSDQQVTNKRPASDHNIRNKEGKNERNKGKPSPPSFEEVCDYVRSMNYEMDPEAFYDYYQDTNWTRKNGMHIKDWQAAVRSWERREKRYRKEHGEREQEYKPIYHKPAQIDPLPEPTPMPDYMKKLFGGGN